jgi:NADPH:quinone reductase-like Zn-dependent oxidoreductase
MKETKMFNALVVDKDDESGKTSAEVRQIGLDDLPDAEVTVAVDYSTVNYKDGLCIGPGGGLVRKYPHVPGIDFAGTVETSSDDRYAPGVWVRRIGAGIPKRSASRRTGWCPCPRVWTRARRWLLARRALPRCWR